MLFIVADWETVIRPNDQLVMVNQFFEKLIGSWAFYHTPSGFSLHTIIHVLGPSHELIIRMIRKILIEESIDHNIVNLDHLTDVMLHFHDYFIQVNN